jgi:hypothetical protein
MHTLADADLLRSEHVTALPDGTPVLFVYEQTEGSGGGSGAGVAVGG